MNLSFFCSMVFGKRNHSTKTNRRALRGVRSNPENENEKKKLSVRFFEPSPYHH